MLSILIPVYNFEVVEFVMALYKQSKTLEVPVEIFCLDDGSEERFLKLNRTLKEYEGVRWEESPENLGRSGVRNRMVEMASFDYLIFLDCDGKVVRDNYIQTYLGVLDRDVVYGGRVYQIDKPDDQALLFHWSVGKAKEEISVEERLASPFKSFMTNNFLIKRSVYDKVKMDERLDGYGHEDTLFAAELRRKGFHIDHIDNPLEHIGLEPADIFLEKSDNALKNLAVLIKGNQLSDRVTLVKFYHRLQTWGMGWVYEALVLGMEDRILRNLKGPAPSLRWFDLWKLARLCRYMRA